MPRYSDAALLTGEFAHLAAELKAGRMGAPTGEDWRLAASENAAEIAAQSIGQQLFALQATVDPKQEQLVIHASTDVGTMCVIGLFPGDGDIVRMEGHLVDTNEPVALLVHVSQLALTITKRPAGEVDDSEDGARIGFVIFDALAKRAEEKAKTKVPTAHQKKSKTTASKKANKT